MKYLLFPSLDYKKPVPPGQPFQLCKERRKFSLSGMRMRPYERKPVPVKPIEHLANGMVAFVGMDVFVSHIGRFMRTSHFSPVY